MSSSQIRDSSRSSNFMLLLYTEDENYVADNVIAYIDMHYEYCMILHEGEIALDDDGNEVARKPHYHVVVTLPFARTVSAMSKSLLIPPRFIAPTQNRRSALRYLIHLDHPEKKQYSPLDVKGNRIDLFNRAIESVSQEEDGVGKICEFIWTMTTQDLRLSTSDVLAYCLANGLYSEFRRGYSILRDVLRERNAEVDNRIYAIRKEQARREEASQLFEQHMAKKKAEAKEVSDVIRSRIETGCK